MMRFHKPKSGRVKSPPRKVVSRRTDQRAWVFKGSRVPPRALFRALADGKSIGEFVKRFSDPQAEEIKNVLRGEGLLVGQVLDLLRQPVRMFSERYHLPLNVSSLELPRREGSVCVRDSLNVPDVRPCRGQ